MSVSKDANQGIVNDSSEFDLLKPKEEDLSQVLEQIKDLDQQVQTLQDEFSWNHLADCSSYTITVLNVTMFVANAQMFFSRLQK